MNDSVHPIRPEIIPTLDVERELIDYCAEKIRMHYATHGEVNSIAFVLIGEVSTAHSWSPRHESASRGECCGYAAALLLKRAVG